MRRAAPPLQGILHRGWEQALDIVFPPRCAGCRVWSRQIFCSTCRPALKPLVPPFCACCGSPFDPLAQSAALCAHCRPNRYHATPPFEALRSVFIFEDPLRQAVHHFKYRGKTALAAPLSTLLCEYLQAPPATVPAIPWQRLGVIVPVPLFAWRRYRRGYNQSELLAHELGRRLDIPVASLLQRTRHTSPQVELSAKKRTENVQDAFAVNERILHDGSRKASWEDRPVLLLDDVCTTGATLRECAAVLKAAGVAEIYALTLAKQL